MQYLGVAILSITRVPSVRVLTRGPYKGDVNICKINTDLNVADPLTKPLPRDKHEEHRSAIGVK